MFIFGFLSLVFFFFHFDTRVPTVDDIESGLCVCVCVCVCSDVSMNGEVGWKFVGTFY